MTNQKYEQLEKQIDYQFNNKTLLKNALTHKTYAFEAKKPVEYNERLELLGDCILDFIIAEQLYQANKYFSEGELTRRKATLVNNVFLAEKAQKLQLGEHLRLGRGEEKQKGRENPTNLANTLEALIGAIYLDSNLGKVKEFILTHIFEEDFQF